MPLQCQGVNPFAFHFQDLVDGLAVEEGEAVGVERLDEVATLFLENAAKLGGFSIGGFAVQRRGKGGDVGDRPIETIGYREGGVAAEKVE